LRSQFRYEAPDEVEIDTLFISIAIDSNEIDRQVSRPSMTGKVEKKSVSRGPEQCLKRLPEGLTGAATI
jgi:hypothetical protein